MNIYLYELKAYRKNTILWTLVLVGLTLLFMSMFPTIAKEIDEFKKALEGFPEGVRNALGLKVETFGSVNGYYSYTFLYIALCGAIQAMTLGVSISSKEMREKTADFLFTKPVTRSKVLVSKLLAALTSLFITNIVYVAAAVAIANLVTDEEFSLNAFLLISLSLFVISLILFSIGTLLAVLFPKIKSVISISLAVVFGFFVLGMVAGLEETGRYFSPFKYIDYAYVIREESYEWEFLIAGAAIILFSMIVSFNMYKKKDIHTV
ncbi:ABC transporter permease subunit [Lysinibacillus sphaericus]